MTIKTSTTLQTSSQVLGTEVWLSTLHHMRGESHYTLGTKTEYCKHSELFALAPCMWLKTKLQCFQKTPQVSFIGKHKNDF